VTRVMRAYGSSGWSVRRVCHLSMLAAVVALAGCGNAYEQLSMGRWREVGEAQLPIAKESGAFVVTTSVPGEGPVVRAGDLVKARVAVTTVDMFGSTKNNPEPQEVWVWTGREPQVTPEQFLADVYSFGTLGSARARIALIGRHLHEQFEIHLQPWADTAARNLPLRGIIDDPLSRLAVAAQIKGQLAAPLEWPALSLRSQTGGSPSARAEILEICSARLYRRTATMTQLGVILASGDVRYGSWRKGTLGWTAIDAQCPAPDGRVRFQAGPFYYFNPHDPGLLADWGVSYRRLRPPERFPEEWRVVPKTAAEIINERMNAITTRVSVLELQQEGSEQNCQTLKKCEDPQKHEARRLERERLIEEAVRQRKQLECELEKKCEATGSAR
jgi:hypothetical protein